MSNTTLVSAPLVAVTGFVEGFTNTSRFPYAYATLACGHTAKCELKPERLACALCGVEQDKRPYVQGQPYQTCCGVQQLRYVALRNPHVEADRVTTLGDLVACPHCVQADEAEAWLRALDKTTISHSRYKAFCGTGSYHFYRRDSSSPSGVLLAGSVPATPRFDAVMRELGYSGPLSPTEGLYASGAVLR